MHSHTSCSHCQTSTAILPLPATCTSKTSILDTSCMQPSDKMPCCAHVLCVTWCHGCAMLGWESGGSLDFFLTIQLSAKYPPSSFPPSHSHSLLSPLPFPLYLSLTCSNSLMSTTIPKARSSSSCCLHELEVWVSTLPPQTPSYCMTPTGTPRLTYRPRSVDYCQ